MTALEADALLRSVGLRVTAQRVAVLRALRDHPHSTADAVVSRARQSLGSMSVQAAYDVLRACAAAGIVRKIEPAGSPARFETRTGDNHHHLVCRQCGVTVDVDCAVGDTPCLTPEDVAGFVVDEAEVVYWGICTSCQGSTPSHPIHFAEEALS